MILKHFKPFHWWLLSLVMLGAIMLAIPAFGWDLKIAQYFFTGPIPGSQGVFHWADSLSEVVKKWGHWPANAIIIISFVAIIHALFRVKSMRRWLLPVVAVVIISLLITMSPLQNIRSVEKFANIISILSLLIIVVIGFRHRSSLNIRVALFVVMLNLAVPALSVNGVLKSAMGRPRPVNVQQFGGPASYQDWYVINWAQKKQHKSFSSGHAANAAMLLSLFWLSRGFPVRQRLGLLLLGLFWWAFVALGRMTAGAHFLSDTVASLWLTVFFGGLLARTWLPKNYSAKVTPKSLR